MYSILIIYSTKYSPKINQFIYQSGIEEVKPTHPGFMEPQRDLRIHPNAEVVVHVHLHAKDLSLVQF